MTWQRRRVACFDLDSTLADTSHRRHLLPPLNPAASWDEYAAACPGDAPITGTVALARALWPTHLIHIVSGRSASAREATVEWLHVHEVPYDELYLRGPGDLSDNALAKARYVTRLREHGLDPVMLIEDWPAVARFVRETTGLPVLLVNPAQHDDAAGDAAITIMTETGF